MDRPLSPGDIICNDSNGSVYMVRDSGLLEEMECTGEAVPISELSGDLWRYDRSDEVKDGDSVDQV